MQRIVRQIDAGPVVVDSTPLPISAQDTAQSLGERLAEASGRLLASALPLLLEGNPPLQEQEPSRVTHCRTKPKAAGAVDWQGEWAPVIERQQLRSAESLPVSVSASAGAADKSHSPSQGSANHDAFTDPI